MPPTIEEINRRSWESIELGFAWVIARYLNRIRDLEVISRSAPSPNHRLVEGLVLSDNGLLWGPTSVPNVYRSLEINVDSTSPFSVIKTKPDIRRIFPEEPVHGWIGCLPGVESTMAANNREIRTLSDAIDAIRAFLATKRGRFTEIMMTYASETLEQRRAHYARPEGSLLEPGAWTEDNDTRVIVASLLQNDTPIGVELRTEFKLVSALLYWLKQLSNPELGPLFP